MTQSTKISIALFLLSCALGIPPAAADDVARNTRYLALGDSIAFGYNPLVIPVDLDKYVGYPEIVSQTLHRKVANASCFGESSESFLVLHAPDIGCEAWRASLPLHVSYSGTQMQYALDYLQANVKKTDLITIDIGVNDNDPVEVKGLLAINGVLFQIASAFDVKVADAFAAFLAADVPFGNDSCTAGLLVILPNGTCDIHASLAGQTLIAQTVVDLIG